MAVLDARGIHLRPGRKIIWDGRIEGVIESLGPNLAPAGPNQEQMLVIKAQIPLRGGAPILQNVIVVPNEKDMP